MSRPDPDDLLRDQLAEHNPMWKALADTLDEWQWRMHGAASGSHNVGAFLRFLNRHGYCVVPLATGGSVDPSRVYLIGESGPEVEA